MTRRTIREALAAERPLVTVLAHDLLSAKLIERAGFRAFNIGGSSLLAARYGIPDLGLVGLGEMLDGMREIAGGTSLPFIADADDGYGDVKSTVRTVRSYERIGVGAMLFEDQLRDDKRQRAEKSTAVVDRAVIEAKLRAAMATRDSRETLIFGRTDALGAVGMDEALIRAERFLDLGADGVFIAGVRRPEDFERVAEKLRGALLIAALFEEAGSQNPSTAELGKLGFGQITFPVSVIFRAVSAMAAGMRAIREHATAGAELPPYPEAAAARTLMDEAIDPASWTSIAATFAPAREATREATREAARESSGVSMGPP